MKTRVMIVDEHASVREMIAQLLPREGPYELVAETGSGLEAIHLCRKTNPQLIVFDLMLPGLNGAGLLKHLRERFREVRMLVFCGSAQQQLILEALRNRPHGFVFKRDSWGGFIDAVKMVTAGYLYFTPFATRLLDGADKSHQAFDLTSRQATIVQMIAEGRSNKEMAAELALSAKTVEHHRSRVMKKLGVHDIAGLIRYAARQGLIDLERA